METSEVDPLNFDLDENSTDQLSQNSYDEENDEYYDDSDDFIPDDIEIVNEPISLKDLKNYEIPVGEMLYCLQRCFKFECMYCINVYERFGLLTEHILDVHFPFDYLPTKVSRRQNAGELKCGKILMSEIREFVLICYLCQESFDEFKKFSHHILDNHLGSDGIMKVNSKEGNLDANNSQNNGLKIRQSISLPINSVEEDGEEKPCKCRYCNKGFKRDSDRKRHERIHTGEKPYKCDMCDKAFTQSGTLKGHKRTHFFQKFRQ